MGRAARPKGMPRKQALPRRTWPSPEPLEPLLHWRVPEESNFFTPLSPASTTYLGARQGNDAFAKHLEMHRPKTHSSGLC